jgi:hypothetical protein
MYIKVMATQLRMMCFPGSSLFVGLLDDCIARRCNKALICASEVFHGVDLKMMVKHMQGLAWGHGGSHPTTSLTTSQGSKVSMHEELQSCWHRNNTAVVEQALMEDRLLESKDWGVLIGHYLGMDHAGHTFSVDSQEMHQKIQQMDEQIVEVCL